MEYFSIDIDSKQLRRAYLVYIVEVKHESKGEFFYIGQTGDRKHRVARSGFRRLAGHLNDQGYSTENQVYREVARKILGYKCAKERKSFCSTIKENVSIFFSKSKVKMHIYSTGDFNGDIEQEAHSKFREYVELVERRLIQHVIREYGEERVLNKVHKSVIKEISNFDDGSLKEIIEKLPKRISLVKNIQTQGGISPQFCESCYCTIPQVPSPDQK